MSSKPYPPAEGSASAEGEADGDGTSGGGDAVAEGDGLSDGEGVFGTLVEVVVTAAGVAHAPSTMTSATGANVGRNFMAAIVLIPLCGKTAGSGPCSRSAAVVSWREVG
jgi:hypothetical protein